MGEGGDAHTSPTAPPSETIPSLVQAPAQQRPVEINVNGPVIEDIASVASPGLVTPNPFTRKNTSLDLDDYFSGPRDLQKHSKWPIFLQMHGSILPKMILPLLAVAAWSTLFTVLHMKVAKMGIQSILLTVLGFVVGLGLSFRNSTAYERYIEGRKYWAQLALACNNLGRMYWVHAVEREEFAEEDVLAKLTALNLLVAFATALKHKLRFEPYTNYDDIASLVDHLDTFAKSATKEDAVNVQRLLRKRGFFKSVGESLGVSFAESNPRKALKRATRPVGNLPLEILSYLGAFTDDLVKNGQLPVPMHQTITYNNMATLNDVMTGTERVLNTPLPIAYSISISQITWVYILVLPFQLLGALEWVTIPATVFAAYIILGLLFIGFEIENPFGRDVNDLNLEAFCAQIATEMDIIASRPRPKAGDWIKSANNHVLWPLSNSGYQVWSHRGTAKIREAIIHKVESNFAHKKAAAELAEAGKTQSHTKSPVVEKLNGENV